MHASCMALRHWPKPKFKCGSCAAQAADSTQCAMCMHAWPVADANVFTSRTAAQWLATCSVLRVLHCMDAIVFTSTRGEPAIWLCTSSQKIHRLVKNTGIPPYHGTKVGKCCSHKVASPVSVDKTNFSKR
jgi:hypothetical protein